MKILIVYDSVFNNTEKIAFGIKEILSHKHDVEVKKASTIKSTDLSNLDYLFIGSPTRVFKPTKMIKMFIKQLNATLLPNINIAVFDTRIVIDQTDPKVLRKLENKFGYANDSMIRLINNSSMTKQCCFYVDDIEGPLTEGELNRAKFWAEDVIRNHKTLM